MRRLLCLYVSYGFMSPLSKMTKDHVSLTTSVFTYSISISVMLFYDMVCVTWQSMMLLLFNIFNMTYFCLTCWKKFVLSFINVVNILHQSDPFEVRGH